MFMQILPPEFKLDLRRIINEDSRIQGNHRRDQGDYGIY